MSEIDVKCAPAPDGWRCTATIRDRRSSSYHEVTVGTLYADELAAAIDVGHVQRLVEETFDFLLEREPKESILRSFDLSVVSRYFPEFEHEIRSRLAP